MQTSKAHDRDGAMRHFVEWWHAWKRRRAAMEELDCCGDDETAHIARDVGVSASELRTLAGKWPNSADLLSRRIDASGLAEEHIAATEPQVLRDLQRVCTQCSERSRCAHDLGRDETDRVWRGYCPNVTTFDALRTEDRNRRLLRRRRKWRSF